jgi:uncharacterized membrane protein YjjP (DUF1212 family)
MFDLFTIVSGLLSIIAMVLTTFGSISMYKRIYLYRIFALITIIAFSMFFLSTRKNNNIPTQNTPTYTDQLLSLDNITKSLHDLLTFVESQKAGLKETEAVLSQLKEEKDRLRPIVESDKQLVASILDAKLARENEYKWKDRFISFFIGFIASALASAAGRWVASFLNKKKTMQAP